MIHKVYVPGLGGGSRDTHGTITAINALHFNEGALLISFVSETDETIAARLASHGIGHDLCGLAGRESALEK